MPWSDVRSTPIPELTLKCTPFVENVLLLQHIHPHQNCSSSTCNRATVHFRCTTIIITITGLIDHLSNRKFPVPLTHPPSPPTHCSFHPPPTEPTVSLRYTPTSITTTILFPDLANPSSFTTLSPVVSITLRFFPRLPSPVAKGILWQSAHPHPNLSQPGGLRMTALV